MAEKPTKISFYQGNAFVDIGNYLVCLGTEEEVKALTLYELTELIDEVLGGLDVDIHTQPEPEGEM